MPLIDIRCTLLTSSRFFRSLYTAELTPGLFTSSQMAVSSSSSPCGRYGGTGGGDSGAVMLSWEL